MTSNERTLLVKVARLRLETELGANEWYRAERGGERVTLAALHRKGLLERRAHRGTEGAPDAAHEYRATDAVVEGVRKATARVAAIKRGDIRV